MQRLENELGVRITRGKLIRYNQKCGLAQDLYEHSDVAIEIEDLLNIFNGQSVKFSEAATEIAAEARLLSAEAAMIL